MMNEAQRVRAPERIERNIQIVGSLAALAALLAFTWRDSVGIVIGAAVTWLNFRWLRTSVVGLTNKLAQTPDASGSTFRLALKFLLRYAVVVAAVYATLNSSVASVLGVLAGLLLIVPALMIEAAYELYLSRQRDTQVPS